VGASMAAGGSMTIGGIQAFVQYVRSFTQPITQMANISNQLQMTVAAAERIFQFLDEEEEAGEEPKLRTADLDIQGNIVFDHVKFGYEDSEGLVIRDFSATVKAGQKVAIVGPTGAGKTTMVKLLMRFHDLKGGQITLDGHPITDFSRTDLRSRSAWCFRTPGCTAAPFWRTSATASSPPPTRRWCRLPRWPRPTTLSTLPGGYQMELNERVQRVPGAEAAAHHCRYSGGLQMLILDEATSSVDTRPGAHPAGHGQPDTGPQHHRPPAFTIRSADLILCMKDGDIVEQGTHEELMEKGGFYAELYNSQFEAAAQDQAS
ncbi:MAG: ATP-binding cassette domain-containing protein, partial [Acutalibacter sp.]